jgi:multidrug efflux pump subunit AcrB
MSLARNALRQPWTVLVAVVAVCLGAWVGLQRMTRDVFPPLGVPSIYVAQPYGGMDPLQMEGFLTYRYEYHFLYISNIEHVESKSIQGASIMKLQFHPGTDMSQAMSETVAQVNRSRAFMPPGTVAPFIMRFDAGSVPVGYLVFSTDDENITLNQMQDQALNKVRPAFATLPGVSAPPPFGGSSRSIVVNVQPDRMRSYGLSPDEIVSAIAKGNPVSPSGNINLDGLYPIVPSNAIVTDIKDLEAIPLKRGGQGSVFLRDVATVADGADVTTSYALANGKRTVYLPVTKRAEASTLAVVQTVKAAIPEFQKLLPPGVKVSFAFDQTPVVQRAIDDLVHEGVVGAILTGLMVLLFLRDVRSALVVVINIPLSLLAAAFGLWLTGQSIHLMTLGGMALAVGILVDEATVTVENIHRQLASGKSLARAALDGTTETTLPRFLAMLCILAVFIPAFFMTGAAQALFVPLALAVGLAMAASFVLSSTLVPVLSVWLLRRSAHREEASGPLTRLYSGLVRMAVGLRWILVPAYLLGCVAVIGIFGPLLGAELFPKTGAGQFALRFRAPSGTQVAITEGIAKQILSTIAREAGGEDKIEMTIGMVGVHNASFPVNLVHLWNGGPEEGWLAVQLKPEAKLRVENLEERLRTVLSQELPQVRLSFEPQDIVARVMSFGSPCPIEVAVSGPSLSASKAHAETLLAKFRELPYLRDVQIAQTLDAPSVNVKIDREQAGLLGVTVEDETKSLVAATTSSRFTSPVYWADPATGISFNVQVQIPEERTQSLEDLGNIPVSSRDGGTVLLRNLAKLETGTAPGTYERYNMVRVVSLTANYHGTDFQRAIEGIRRVIREVGPAPDGKTKVDLRGQVVPFDQLREGFTSGLVLSVIVIALLLCANFQSIRLTITVLTALPAAIAGSVLALGLTGTTLNIQSAMGSIMAVGVAVANAILLVTFAERSRLFQGGDPVRAAVDGGVSRLRPILMTSCAMIAGMMPLALGLGEGGEQTAPLGRAVAGGLACATLATLLVLPAVYALLAARSTTSASLDPDDATGPCYEPSAP